MTTVGTKNLLYREAWLQNTLQRIPAGLRKLDAGVGEQQYRKFCAHLKYVALDFRQYYGKDHGSGLQTGAWKQNNLDITGDICAVPQPDESFDAIMCVEAFEHLSDPIAAIREFARLLRTGGQLILTAPFCNLSHFAPYHFYSGFSRYFYETQLPAFGLQVDELVENGNYFEYLAQEVRRIPPVANRYAKKRPTILETIAVRLVLIMLDRFSACEKGSSELLHYGCHVRATKK